MTEIASVYGPIEVDIPLVGERLRGLVAGHHPLLGETLAHVFDSGGKRVRPALVLLSGKLGNYRLTRLVTLATSLEVVHTATLVHDDTIDQALTRRGMPTVSAVWNSKVAILVGDFLFAQSAHLAAQLDSVPIMALLSETVMAMSSGELRQYASSQTREVDETDYFERIAGKTASLFAMCCQGAAIVSDQPPEGIEALRLFGRNLGLAFQIVDDVLDFAGSEATLGKPAGSDLRQGTVTLPVILLANSLTSPADLLAKVRAGIDPDGVVDRVRTSGILDDALARATLYKDDACAALDVFPAGEAKQSLLNLAASVLSRNF